MLLRKSHKETIIIILKSAYLKPVLRHNVNWALATEKYVLNCNQSEQAKWEKVNGRVPEINGEGKRVDKAPRNQIAGTINS